MTEKTLTPEQWLKVVRSHWGFEINHHTLDTAFVEDERPWIVADGNGMLVTLVRPADRLCPSCSLPQRQSAQRDEGRDPLG